MIRFLREENAKLKKMIESGCGPGGEGTDASNED
jgi:hypothetical protein